MARLTPELLVRAYCMGAFPMAGPRGEIRWYAPDPRALLPLESYHLPRSLARTIRRGVFDVRVNTAFDTVIRACAARRETWISPEIIRAYEELHALGLAHSVESWRDGELAGGLYGVALGGAFFGESMFTRVTDGSKVALAALVERLRARGFVLLDTQYLTEHLARFGTIELSRTTYMTLLNQALRLDRSFVGGSNETQIDADERG